jgi:hypothetical protein
MRAAADLGFHVVLQFLRVSSDILPKVKMY